MACLSLSPVSPVCDLSVSLSIEEHLSQVQVCVSLAKFYLRQKKHHKVVQLYKQALSAASHCEVRPAPGNEPEPRPESVIKPEQVSNTTCFQTCLLVFQDTTIRDQLLDQLMTSLQRLNLQVRSRDHTSHQSLPVDSFPTSGLSL